MRAIPGMAVINPADGIESKKAVFAAATEVLKLYGLTAENIVAKAKAAFSLKK